MRHIHEVQITNRSIRGADALLRAASGLLLVLFLSMLVLTILAFLDGCSSAPPKTMPPKMDMRHFGGLEAATKHSKTTDQLKVRHE